MIHADSFRSLIRQFPWLQTFKPSSLNNRTDKTYKVTRKQEWNHVYLEDDNPKDPQTRYQIDDPTNDLPRYKERFMRHELLLVKKK